jgi:hypothetical protein
MRAALGILALGGVLLCTPAAPVAGVLFHARDEALSLAFPDATRTEPKEFFLTAEQHGKIEKLAHAKLDTDLVTIYRGWRGDELLGYAIFDTHVVRTLPETFLVVLSPQGAVEATNLLAFYEPEEYMPSDRWLRQFDGKQASDDLNIGHGIVGITGSTLTSQAVAAGIRRALALYAVLIHGE